MNFLSRIRMPYLAWCVFLAFLGCASVPKPGPASGDVYVTMIAAGDNLMHIQLIDCAWDEESGSYDFEGYYSEVRGAVVRADIAFINQETLIAGEAFGYSGYPEFNGPREIGQALVNVGFDVVNHATNHTMDKGEGAVRAVIDYWKTQPRVTMLGLHESQEARDAQNNIVDVNGIRIGFLAYTYGLNEIPLPKGKPYLVSLIDADVMAKEIDALRPRCDFLVVSMHWGNEYEHTPSKKQEELAAFLAAHNVDLVIGHHPHVLQPVRTLAKADGGSMLVFFSLGNFLSAQDKRARLLGGMMRIKLKADKDNRVSVEESELLPLVTHYERGHKAFKVYFLENYSEALALLHGVHPDSEALSIEYFIDLIASIAGGKAREE
ncbi:MAG: CapA family protein [Spirochaetaceae bacterium]|jgi:poly-gamma-glutamate synthesis protein (capsule biosynthesis protein)|nr:CapA family protein [Spirochaetaceae bacterium]